MLSRKLIVSHGGRLKKKYGANGVKAINDALVALAKADEKRGLTTLSINLDDAAEMKKCGAKAVGQAATAASCATAIDQLFSTLSPDYLVLLGSDDVIPHFAVDNPSFAGADTDAEVPTDNPYASSQKFSKKKRETYLVPDRVVGRIPDLPGSKDSAWVTDYLQSAAAWQSSPANAFGEDLMVCCDAWRQAGESCVSYIARDAARLLISPPTLEATADITGRHAARLQMIKCHGAPYDPRFFGQPADVNDFPPVMVSTSLLNRTTKGTVVGAMCCYGAALFDPADPRVSIPSSPPIASVYLRQGAYGFAGSTTLAWVGVQSMMCADWVIASFLRDVMRGSSLGRAFLDAKQGFLKWINDQGQTPSPADEKTLLQFLLLGDPSIQLVATAQPAVAAAGGMTLAAAPSPAAAAMARRARRQQRFETGRQLRETVPTRVISKVKAKQSVLDAIKQDMVGFEGGAPVVQRVSRDLAQPEMTSRAPRLRAAVAATAIAGMTKKMSAASEEASKAVVKEETLQYLWIGRKSGQTASPVLDAKLVHIETDKSGNVLRHEVLVSS